MNLTAELKELKVIQRGRVVLKGGQVSDYYIDMKKIFGNPRVFGLISDELCKIIDKKATCIAGSGHGGLPLATAVSFKLGLPLVLVRDKVKKHGLQKMIDGYIPTKKDGIVIVDDIFTTGTCISNIVKNLGPTNAKILGGYVVLSRGDMSKFKVPVKSLLTLNELIR